MMRPFFDASIFPPDVKLAIVKYLENPAASSCTDLNLFRILKEYDRKAEGVLCVENIEMKALFSIKGGRIFRKESLVRKRYRCVEIKTGAVYLFPPLAEVSRV
jgi:hypothetical protein